MLFSSDCVASSRTAPRREELGVVQPAEVIVFQRRVALQKSQCHLDPDPGSSACGLGCDEGEYPAQSAIGEFQPGAITNGGNDENEAITELIGSTDNGAVASPVASPTEPSRQAFC